MTMVASTGARGSDPDERARDRGAADRRRAVLAGHQLSGATRFTGGVRDKRYPDELPLTAGYTPGVPRLGVPALLSSDASMGITNPGFRPDDKGATAMSGCGCSASNAWNCNPAYPAK
jgi:beta-glucosidase